MLVIQNAMHSFIQRLLSSRWLFAFTLLVVIYGLFFVPNSNEKIRVWDEVTNLGHIGAFILIWLFSFNIFPRLQRLSAVQLLMLVVVITLVLGKIIEIIQGFIGRDDEWQDVWDSGVGALSAVVYGSQPFRQLPKFPRRTWQALALIVLITVPLPIWSSLVDEWAIQRQVPVLSDFSTPFETSRWQKSNASIELQKSPGQATAFLSVTFEPGEYSSVILEYFYRDWRGYKNLVLDVTNPDKQEFNIVLRIHDRLHKQHHFELSDRFNRKLMMKPGTQRIVIPLSEVANAPKSRKMDMQHLEELMLFTMQSSTTHHLQIHRIYLESH